MGKRCYNNCDHVPCNISFVSYDSPVSKPELPIELCLAFKLIFLMKMDCLLYNFRSYTCGNVRCKKCSSNSTAFNMVVSCLYLPFTDLLEFSEDASGVPEGNKKSTNKQGDKSKENTRKIFSGPKRVSNNTETKTKFLF